MPAVAVCQPCQRAADAYAPVAVRDPDGEPAERRSPLGDYPVRGGE